MNWAYRLGGKSAGWKELEGTLRRWVQDDGIDPEVIEKMIDNFARRIEDGLDIRGPAWKLFLMMRSDLYLEATRDMDRRAEVRQYRDRATEL